MKDTKKVDFINSIAAIDIVKTVQDHTKLLIFKLNARAVQGKIKCPRVKEILTRLCMLYGLSTINEDCRVCYESGYIKAGNFADLVIEAIKQLNS